MLESVQDIGRRVVAAELEPKLDPGCLLGLLGYTCHWRASFGYAPEGTRSAVGHEAADLDALPERRIRRDVGQIEGRMGREASDRVRHSHGGWQRCA
jgi:hypothetical protein